MENCVCFNLRWVSRSITQHFEGELRLHGLLPTQTPILGALAAAQPGADTASLSEWLGMDRTTLVRNLRPLERDGLVKVTGKGRGRKVQLAITSKGRKALQKFLPDWRKAQQKVVRTLGAERWSAIRRSGTRLAPSANERTITRGYFFLIVHMHTTPPRK